MEFYLYLWLIEVDFFASDCIFSHFLISFIFAVPKPKIPLTQSDIEAIKELLATRKRSGAGIRGPEAFDDVPYLELMRDGYGQPYGIREG